MLFEWFLIGVLFQYQKFVDRLKVKAQDQVMLILLFAYQLKMQMCNMITGQSKDKATRRWVLSCHNTLCICVYMFSLLSETMQKNLDENPSRGLMGGVTGALRKQNTAKNMLYKSTGKLKYNLLFFV